MANSTSRLALPLPVGTDPPSELRTAIGALSTAMDPSVLYYSGTLANRSSVVSAPIAGYLYYATDTTQLFEYNGSAWVQYAPALTSGTLASRPSASGVPNGSTYLATDTGTLSVGTGSAWSVFSPMLTMATMSMSGTASAWTSILAGAVVVTLPSASANTNAIIVVRSSTTVTGSSATTVYYTGGIYGVGLSGGTNLYLGTPLASVALQSDGMYWNVIAGQQDTGWVTLPVNSGVTTYAGTPASRLVGDRVYLRGTLSVGAATGGYTLATLATTFRPASQVYYPGAINNSGTQQPAFFQIFTSGVISVPQAISTTTYIPLDGVNYCIS